MGKFDLPEFDESLFKIGNSPENDLKEPKEENKIKNNSSTDNASVISHNNSSIDDLPEFDPSVFEPESGFSNDISDKLNTPFKNNSTEKSISSHNKGLFSLLKPKHIKYVATAGIIYLLGACLVKIGTTPPPSLYQGIVEVGIVAGHGGTPSKTNPGDYGAVSRCKTYNEKDANLYLALKVEEKLKQRTPGLKVHMARTKDVYISPTGHSKWIDHISKEKEKEIVIINLHQNIGNSKEMFSMYYSNISKQSHDATLCVVTNVHKGINKRTGIGIAKSINGGELKSKHGFYSDKKVRGANSVAVLKYGTRSQRNFVLELYGIENKLPYPVLDAAADGIVDGLLDYIKIKQSQNKH